ncbi:Gaa1-like protein [Lipomyces oligophaga]|uniref:Gaa1-like protein n=1 Tax=Lipomyces oligophaga TaxID=45792 RepID=UPI0034CFCA1F
MALLTKFKRRFFRKSGFRSLTALVPVLSVLLSIGGLAWLFVLPLDGQYRRTYISENALLPGQAHTYFRDSEENIVRAFREEIRILKHASESERTEALISFLRDIGYKSDSHWWTVSHNNEVKAGVNVYGVLHAPRGDTTESMVLIAPWINVEGEFNEGGVALAIALARYLTQWSIWSKDIILVIPSDTSFGLSKWVEDYHQSALSASSGSIQGGIVLDFPGQEEHIDAIEVHYAGYQGQLPNLDLINTVVLICGHMHMNVVIQNVEGPDKKYENRAKTLFHGIMDQTIAGFYQRGHGHEPFSGWRIDVVTLTARVSEHGKISQMEYGKLAESTLRSINNLLEHFHQSFFFYLMLSPWLFVSIGTYIPSAILLGASFTVKGIYLFYISNRSGRSTLLPALAFCINVLLGCVLVFIVTVWTPLKYLLVEMVGVSIVSLMLPIIFRIGIAEKTKSFINRIRAFSLIYVGLFLTTLSTLNFSLALILGVLFFPFGNLVIVRQPSTKVQQLFTSLCSAVCLTITCPWICISVYFYYAVYPSGDGLEDFITGIMWNYRGLGVSVFVLTIFLVWLPIWVVTCAAVAISVNTWEKRDESGDMIDKQIPKGSKQEHEQKLIEVQEKEKEKEKEKEQERELKGKMRTRKGNREKEKVSS